MSLPVTTPEDLDPSGFLKCRRCPKVFMQRKSLYRHLQVCHGPPLYVSCKRCSFKTKRKDNLKRHYERVHFSDMLDLKEITRRPECQHESRRLVVEGQHLQVDAGSTVPEQAGPAPATLSHRPANKAATAPTADESQPK